MKGHEGAAVLLTPMAAASLPHAPPGTSSLQLPVSHSNMAHKLPGNGMLNHLFPTGCFNLLSVLASVFHEHTSEHLLRLEAVQTFILHPSSLSLFSSHHAHQPIPEYQHPSKTANMEDATQPSRQAPQIRFLVACPRSGSTRLIRVFAESPDCAVTSRLILMGKAGSREVFRPDYSILENPHSHGVLAKPLESDKRFLISKEELGNSSEKGECLYDVCPTPAAYAITRPVFLICDPVRVFDSWKNVGWTDIEEQLGRLYLGCWRDEARRLRTILLEKTWVGFDLDDTLHEFRRAPLPGDGDGRDMKPAMADGIFPIHLAEAKSVSLASFPPQVNTLKKLQVILSG
ncbi:hypothetical protein RB595_004135 [Gaeumannomyces hyphopodioides]